MADEDDMREKLLLSFNDQFATNQNHGQSLFIQFLSAILVILIGYGYVYANTAESAKLWEATHTPEGSKDIASYAISHLFGAMFISQLILVLLATVVLNIGYSFRRDQLVIFRLRNRILDNEYSKIFGSRSYDPRGQNLHDFLPEFNRMFFYGIFFLQFLLIVSFFIAIGRADQWDSPWTFWSVMFYLLCIAPWIYAAWLYTNYYKKYYWVMSDTDKLWWKVSRADRKKRIDL